MLNRFCRGMIHKAIFAFGLSVLILSGTAEAQRPSLGGLQQQINEMLGGDLFFTEVAFGEDCALCVDPNFTGLVEKDPFGLRLLGLNGQGCILTFGPTDDCRIFIDPKREGMIFRDIGCFVFETPDPKIPAELRVEGGQLRFGDECTIGIDPNFSGIVERDPGGLRLLGLDGQGCILTFGPTDECRILVDPTRPDTGLIVQEEIGVLFENPSRVGGADVRVDGLIAAREFAQTSRRDKKENIRTIENPLEKIMKLRGVNFDWKESVTPKSDKKDRAEIGFVADEVAKVLPEATIFNDKNEADAVKYANMVALVVESVKAQQEMIDAQQETIEELKAEITQMRAQQ